MTGIFNAQVPQAAEVYMRFSSLIETLKLNPHQTRSKV